MPHAPANSTQIEMVAQATVLLSAHTDTTPETIARPAAAGDDDGLLSPSRAAPLNGDDCVYSILVGDQSI